MRIIAFVVGCLAAFGLATPASADDVQAQDPNSVVAAMQQAGYKALLDVDDLGDPMIRSAQSGSDFRVIFYNCTQNTDCRTIQFHLNYGPSANATLETINAWNKSKRFASAYLDDDGVARLEMDVDLDDGGVSQALFEDNLEFWVTLMSQFADHIG